LASSKEVKDAINTSAKKAPGLGKVAMKKVGLEASLVGSILYTQWDNLKEEALSQMTSKELLNQLILATASMIDNETQKKEFDDLSKQVDTVVTSQVVSDLKKLINEAKQKENKKLKEADKDINDVLNFILQENPEDKIGEDSVKIISNINNIGKILLK
jgi:phosphoenolpyruvate-protein kinase (PTS system EI component)